MASKAITQHIAELGFRDANNSFGIANNLSIRYRLLLIVTVLFSHAKEKERCNKYHFRVTGATLLYHCIASTHGRRKRKNHKSL